MDGVLSQEEISALLNNPDDANKNDLLTDAEKDAIGEIGTITTHHQVCNDFYIMFF